MKGDLSSVKQLSRSRISQVLKALSSLAKFQGIHEEFKQLVKNYGLSWAGRSADDLIIDRLNKTQDPEDIWNWIRDVKNIRPEFSEFIDFITVTGLRFSEAFNSYNLIIKLTRENTLADKYYNVKTGFLEHFRFKETFIRSSKKAYVSYVPLEMLEAIGSKTIIPKPYHIQKYLAKRHVSQRFSDVRELNATFLTKFCNSTEIDVIHGRVGSSVFAVHYFNLKLITDLRQRLNQADKEILSKIDTDLGRIEALGGEKE